MTRRFRVFLIVVGIGFGVVASGFFLITALGMRTQILLERDEIAGIPPDLEDGLYRGKFSSPLVAVEVEVLAKDGRIQSIEVMSQRSGPGYQAREILDRVIGAQSLQVDEVSGASASSRAILLAVDRAVNSPPVGVPPSRQTVLRS